MDAHEARATGQKETPISCGHIIWGRQTHSRRASQRQIRGLTQLERARISLYAPFLSVNSISWNLSGDAMAVLDPKENNTLNRPISSAFGPIGQSIKDHIHNAPNDSGVSPSGCFAGCAFDSKTKACASAIDTNWMRHCVTS